MHDRPGQPPEGLSRSFLIHTAPGCPFSLHGQNNCPPVMGKYALRLRPVGTGAWPSRSVWEHRARHRAGGLTAAA